MKIELSRVQEENKTGNGKTWEKKIHARSDTNRINLTENKIRGIDRYENTWQVKCVQTT